MDTSTLRSQAVRLPLWFRYLGIFLLAALIGVGYYFLGPLSFGVILAVPLLAIFLIALFQKPEIGLYSALIIGFFLSVFNRYGNPEVPYGVVVESIVVLTYLALFIKHYRYLSFRMASNHLAWLSALWMFYILLQLANPLSPSMTAWFYAMRGIALIQVLVVTLALVILNTYSDWKRFFKFWVGLSLIALIWAIKQKWFGVTAVEQAWLDAGGHVTHILFGKLRVFSIHSDASAFGASMAHICIVCLILFVGPYSKKLRITFLILGALFFYGLMLSGTRGALAIPAVGGLVYLIMIKNFRYVFISLVVLTLGFSFLKFTTLGHSNYEIYRLRSALNPDDASLAVRLYNRERLSKYLEDKPFGGGLGTTGRMGQRFAPNTWLADFPPDGLYTWIRAETGVVGRNLFVGILLIILFRGMQIVWRLKNESYKNIGIALLAGYAGILLANYGNPVLTSYPNNFFTFISLAVVYSMKHWNDKGEPELEGEDTPVKGRLMPKSGSWQSN